MFVSYIFNIIFIILAIAKSKELTADRDKWLTYKTCHDRSAHKQKPQKQTLQVQVTFC